MKAKSERGAVLIEATLSLTLFMFAMLTVYSVFHICLAQARIHSALNATAKEISQYSYVYGLTGLNDKQAEIAYGGGAAQASLSSNLSEVNSFFDAIKGIGGVAQAIGQESDSFLAYTLNAGIDQIKGDLTGVFARELMRKHMGPDPDGFLIGLGIKDGMNGLKFIKTRLFVGGQGNDILLVASYKMSVIKLLDVDLTFNFQLAAKTRAWMP